MYTWQAAQHFSALGDETRLGLLLTLAGLGGRGGSLEAIAERTGMEPAELNRVFDQLIAARLARLDPDSGRFHADLETLGDLFSFLRGRLADQSAPPRLLANRQRAAVVAAPPRSLRAMLGERSAPLPRWAPSIALAGLSSSITASAPANDAAADADGRISGTRRGDAGPAANLPTPASGLSAPAPLIVAADHPADKIPLGIARPGHVAKRKTSKNDKLNSKGLHPGGSNLGASADARPPSSPTDGGPVAMPQQPAPVERVAAPNHSVPASPQTAMEALSAVVVATLSLPPADPTMPLSITGAAPADGRKVADDTDHEGATAAQLDATLPTMIRKVTIAAALNGQTSYPRVRVVVDRSAPELKFWLVPVRLEAPQLAQSAAAMAGEPAPTSSSATRPRKLSEALAAIGGSRLRGTG